MKFAVVTCERETTALFENKTVCEGKIVSWFANCKINMFTILVTRTFLTEQEMSFFVLSGGILPEGLST